MLVSELLAAQAAILAIPASEITGDDEKLALFLTYCSDAQQALADYRDGDWPWLQVLTTLATVEDQDYLDLPADFGMLLETAGPYYAEQNGFPFLGGALASILGLRAASATSGQPTRWAMTWNAVTDRHSLALWPTPDAAYSLIIPYRRVLGAFSSIDQTIAVPPGLLMALRLLCMALAEERWERIAEGSQRAAAMTALEAAWRTYHAPERCQVRHVMRSVMEEDHPPWPAEDVVPVLTRIVVES